MAECNFMLDAYRPNPYPNYELGNVAILRIITTPQQPDRKVCRKRWFRKPGEVSYRYQGEVQIGSTDLNGILVRYAYLSPNNSSLLGDYIDRYYIHDCPAQYDVSIYSISSKESIKTRLAELNEKVEKPIEELLSVV